MIKLEGMPFSYDDDEQDTWLAEQAVVVPSSHTVQVDGTVVAFVSHVELGS